LFDDRKNSFGPNIEIDSNWAPLKAKIDVFMGQDTQWRAFPIVGGEKVET
jgi:RHH-type proline utilization regulon transcriptional repressor/proline dehydrogenase/delta 1-pyrroline-5-carboxylate dehydrogenase